MNRQKRIAVYTGVRNNKRFWTMRETKDATMFGYWYVGEYDGQEKIQWKTTWPNWLLASPHMPADFWLVNQPTEKDFS